MERRVLHSQQDPFEGHESHRNVLLKCHGDSRSLSNEARALEAAVESTWGGGQLGPFISSVARRGHRANLAHQEKPPAGRGPHLEAKVCAGFSEMQREASTQGRGQEQHVQRPCGRQAAILQRRGFHRQRGTAEGTQARPGGEVAGAKTRGAPGQAVGGLSPGRWGAGRGEGQGEV